MKNCLRGAGWGRGWAIVRLPDFLYWFFARYLLYEVLIPQTDNYLKSADVILFTVYQSCNLRGKRYAKQIQVTVHELRRIYIFHKLYYSSVLHARPCFKRDLCLIVLIANKNLSNNLKISATIIKYPFYNYCQISE